MITENPFLEIAKRLDKIEGSQAETLQLLRSYATNSVTKAEMPVTAADAARQYGIAKQTLYQNVKKIKHIKRFGRLYFYPDDLKAFLNAGEGVTDE